MSAAVKSPAKKPAAAKRARGDKPPAESEQAKLEVISKMLDKLLVKSEQLVINATATRSRLS